VIVVVARNRTFGQVLHNTCDIPLSKFPKPCLKGDMIYVQISEEDYLAGLEECKNNLHSRIVLSKGDKSLTHLEVHKKLEGAWKL